MSVITVLFSKSSPLIYTFKQLDCMFPYLPELVVVSSQHTSLFSQFTNLIIISSQHAFPFPHLPDLNVTGSQPALLFLLLNPSGRVSVASQYMFLFPKVTC
jgi:hypothetical protein